MTDAGLLGVAIGLVNGSRRRAIERQTQELIAAAAPKEKPVTQGMYPVYPPYVPRNYVREQQMADAAYDRAMDRFRKTGDKRDLPRI